MVETPNLHLNKFEATDKLDYRIMNENADVLDGAISRPNLLDNPWFTISQAGYFENHGSTKFACDRWMASGGITSVTFSDGLVIKSNSTNEGLTQRIHKGILHHGDIVTFSVNVDGVVYRANTIHIELDGVGRNVNVLGTDAYHFYYRSYESSGYVDFKFVKNTAWNGEKVIAMKIELGSSSTLKNDLVPDYAVELLKCQRYFFIRHFYPSSNAYGYSSIYFPTNMRIVPSITLSAGSVGYVSHSCIAISGMSANTIIGITVTATADL